MNMISNMAEVNCLRCTRGYKCLHGKVLMIDPRMKAIRPGGSVSEA